MELFSWQCISSSWQNTVGFIVAFLFTYGLVWMCYAMAANDHATNRLDEKREAVIQLMREKGLGYVSIGYGDIASCDVRYSTVGGAKCGIPSRKFLRWIRRGDFTKLHEKCIAAEEKYAHKQKKKDIFPV